MSEEKVLTEKESLELIATMIQKAKNNFHERGTSAIMWGALIGFCGLFSFLQFQFNFSIGGLDIWYLALIAIIPQIYLSIKESKEVKVKTHHQEALNAVWLVYGITIFGVVVYGNLVPGATEEILKSVNKELLEKNILTGEVAHYRPQVYSQSSLLLLVYAFPTLVTSMVKKFKPMFYGAILCYALFLVSLFTPVKYDMLFNGIAGIFNWLIPGLILKNRYKKGIPC